MDRTRGAWGALALIALVACGGESGVSGARDGDTGVDEDRGLDERLPWLSGGSGAGEDGMGGSDTDAGRVDADAMIAGGMGGYAGAAGMSGESGSGGSPLGGTGGDGDAAVEEMPCPDADSDSVCDAEDACPVGPDHLCDRVLWSIDFPEQTIAGDGYTELIVASVAFKRGVGETVGVSLYDRDHVEQSMLTFDGIDFWFDLDQDGFDTIANAMSKSFDFKGYVGFAFVQSGEVTSVIGNESPCPFDPRTAVLSRISVNGRLRVYANGLGGAIRVDVRGYLRP